MSVVKPIGNLKAFLDAQKKPQRLLGHVERHMMSQPPGHRATNVLHPSEIVKHDWCIRASYYVLIGRTTKTGVNNLRRQNIFDEGHSIHDKWQQRFWSMGTLFGKFSCRACNKVWWDTSPKTCPACGQHRGVLRYDEVSLVSDPEYGIVGHSDGWVRGIGDDCLIEVKSIGAGTVRMEAPAQFAKADGNLDQMWMDINRPFKTHILQGSIYLEVAHQMAQRGFFDGTSPQEIVFIYELKANQAIKEFTVRRDPGLVADILDKAGQVVRAIDKGVPPACNIDTRSGCHTCRAYEEDA